MAGQVAYHLLAQGGAARALWPITTLVSCLPVLVLAMGTALAHMLRADAHTAADGPDHAGTAAPAAPWSAGSSAGGQAGPAQDQGAPADIRVRSPNQDHDGPHCGPRHPAVKARLGNATRASAWFP